MPFLLFFPRQSTKLLQQRETIWDTPVFHFGILSYESAYQPPIRYTNNLFNNDIIYPIKENVKGYV